jgi:hypothetical protein
MSHKSAATVYLPHVDSISVPVLKAVSDPYYKITAEALRVTSQIIKVSSISLLLLLLLLLLSYIMIMIKVSFIFLSFIMIMMFSNFWINLL